MTICPICNGLKELNLVCNACGENLRDCGRVMDYYDEYSAYMEIDLLKMEDGMPNTYVENKCPHLYCCETCHQDKIVLIKE